MTQSKATILISLLILVSCTRQDHVLTVDRLNNLTDYNLEQTIVDGIRSKMDSQFSNEAHIVRNLSKGQRAIYVSSILESEVSNGGFNQFYFNSSGQFADLTEDAFSTIGAPQYADLVRRANLIYDSIKGDLKKYDDGTIENFSKSYDNSPLNALDSIFYALNRKEPLHKIKIKYIRNNIQEFVNE